MLKLYTNRHQINNFNAYIVYVNSTIWLHICITNMFMELTNVSHYLFEQFQFFVVAIFAKQEFRWVRFNQTSLLMQNSI